MLEVMNYIDDINISGAMGLLQGRNEDFELTTMPEKLENKTFLNLSYKRSFSLNQSAIGVEYKLNKHFSVVGNIDESGKLNLKYRYRYVLTFYLMIKTFTIFTHFYFKRFFGAGQ